MWQLAWAAGLFDGEGTTSVLAAKRDKWQYPRMSMAQKDPEVLYKLQALLGGKIYASTTRNIYNWNVYKKEDVIDALNKLWPYLSEAKKKQAIKVFERCERGS
jgi:hypothetical protein